jgi:hypothetical protein
MYFQLVRDAQNLLEDLQPTPIGLTFPGRLLVFERLLHAVKLEHMASTAPAFLHADIPTEIYLAIADYFPLSSIVALTLTSKRLLDVTVANYAIALKTSESDETSFFSSKGIYPDTTSPTNRTPV